MSIEDLRELRPSSARGEDARLSESRRERVYRRHAHAAFVRSRASGIMWLAAVAAYFFEIVPEHSFVGISASVVYLILLNPPTLWVLNRLDTAKAVRLWSLAITCLEIVGYTAVIHFSGGIEAANLTLIYAALIAYLGVLGSGHLAFVVATLCSLSFAAMVVAEHLGWLTHQSLVAALPIAWATQVEILLVTISLLFVVASLSARASALLWASKQKLRESESQFRTLVENVPGVVYLAVPEPDSRILYLGGSVEGLTGRTAEELIAGTRALLDLCHPDELSGVRSKIDLAVLDRTDYVVSYRLRHADGDWRWVEERGQPVFDERGRLLFLEGIVLEISERKSLEKETSLRQVIQQVAREWQLTFDSVESPILILDIRGRIKRLNRAARDLSGLNYEECGGRLLSEIRSENPWQAAEQLVGEVAASRGGVPLHRMAVSETRNWQLTATLSPRFAEERIVLIMQDATRIVELEDSLQRGEKLAAIGSLVGGVAHEVRNPLFGVSATLDAMRAGFEDDVELRPYLRGLRSQVDRMTELMNSLLEYGRSAGTERSLGQLEDVIAQAVKDCQPLARQAKVDVIQTLKLDGLSMAINRDSLVTLFSNLVSNALQYSPPGSRVSVEASVAGGGEESWVECVVADSGSGFSEESLTRACEPFFSRRPGGMGLGLAMVERIAEDHGGKLTLRNRASGGAEVRVRLPIEKALSLKDTVATSARA